MRPEEVIAKVFGVPVSEVTDDTSNKTIRAWDSLGHLTLVLELESTYRVSLSPEEVFNMTNVKSVKRTLADHSVIW
jgi:acyl carrier protein